MKKLFTLLLLKMHPENDLEDYETFHAALVIHFGLVTHQPAANFSLGILGSPFHFPNNHEDNYCLKRSK